MNKKQRAAMVIILIDMVAVGFYQAESKIFALSLCVSLGAALILLALSIDDERFGKRESKD